MIFTNIISKIDELVEVSKSNYNEAILFPYDEEVMTNVEPGIRKKFEYGLRMLMKDMQLYISETMIKKRESYDVALLKYDLKSWEKEHSIYWMDILRGYLGFEEYEIYKDYFKKELEEVI